jgi:pimeloyl-ACP methyl ester carboxylesterase
MAQNKIIPNITIQTTNLTSKIPIIFLPGLNMKPKDYNKFLLKIKNKKIITISPHESKPKITSVQDYLNLIKETIKIYNLKKFDLIGHSLGGGTALNSSSLKPRKIIAINPLLELEGKIPLYIKKFSKIPQHKFKKRFTFYISFTKRYIKNFYSLNKLIKDIEKFKIKKNTTPTLILLSKEDELFSEKNIPKKKFTNLKITKTSGRHFSTEEQPEEIAQKILNFLK